MKFAPLFAPLAASIALAPAVAQDAVAAEAVRPPAARIDVQKMPSVTTMVDSVVVPLPSEIFGVLDKLGKPNWTEVLRPMAKGAKPPGEQHQTALMLGTIIAEGFIAVEAENTEEVKKIGSSVLTFAEALGVRENVLQRSNAIITAAERKQWQDVRKQLDGTLKDVKGAMAELNSEALSQLVSLGGWMRGTEALASVVQRDYKKDSAELLYQPVLLDYFDRRLSSLPAKMAREPVPRLQQGLRAIKPLLGNGGEISEKSVKDIGEITAELVKNIHSRVNP